MDKVSVIPLLQVGGVSFGCSRDSVRKAFGQYKEYRKGSISKNTSDDFGFCHVYYDKENRCEAIEFFSGCKVEVDDTIVFPGDVDKAIKKLGDFEQKCDCFINLRQSIGITASDGKMESILFGKKDYYKQLMSKG